MEFLNGVNKAEVLKYLGYKGGEIEKSISDKIDRIARSIPEAAEPKVCSFRVKILSQNPLVLENTDIKLSGEDIKNHLAGCSECIFMAATLGVKIDKLIKKISLEDMSEAVIFDACASSAIENLCDNYQKKLEEEYREKNLYLTDRFSPGYGDLPIESQQDFCTVMDTARKIGLYCNRAMMLTPSKSVTAIIGVSEIPQEKRKIGCEGCSLFYDCNFRKRGVTCYE